MERKNIAFPVTTKEHEKIKVLAAKEHRTIKQLFLDMLDKLYPEWNEEKNENGPK